MNSKEFRVIAEKWHFVDYFVVDAVERKGGIALCWYREVNLTVLSYSSNYIMASIVFAYSYSPLVFAGFFYGESAWPEK